ncbi:MAG: DUF1036 domain-containing protein [Pseudomonadota bacterium]
MIKTGSGFVKLFLVFSLLGSLATAGSLFTATPAKADFRICNDTKSLVGAALGYRQEGRWISEGWFQIQAETCNSLIEGDLSSRFYYIYAEDADKGGQWRGDVFMCTNDREFKIEGVEDCFKRGHIKTGFFEIDTGNRNSWMVRLTEQSQSAPAQ